MSSKRKQTDTYPNWTVMEGDEQSESSKGGKKQLKSDGGANSQLNISLRREIFYTLMNVCILTYCHCKHFPVHQAAPPQLHPPA